MSHVRIHRPGVLGALAGVGCATQHCCFQQAALMLQLRLCCSVCSLGKCQSAAIDPNMIRPSLSLFNETSNRLFRSPTCVPPLLYELLKLLL